MINPAILITPEINAIVNTNQFDREIEMINRHAGIIPISVQPELYALIRRSLRLKSLADSGLHVFHMSADHQIELNPLLLSVYLPISGMTLSLSSTNNLHIN